MTDGPLHLEAGTSKLIAIFEMKRRKTLRAAQILTPLSFSILFYIILPLNKTKLVIKIRYSGF